MPRPKVITPRSRSHCKHTRNPYLGHSVKLDGDGDDLIVVHDTGVVFAGGICPVRTCLV